MKALVTNCTRNSGHAALRALAAAGWAVEGADDRVPRWPVHSRWTRDAYVLLPPEDHAGFPAALLALVQRVRPDVLLPTRGIEVACRLRTDLDRHCASLLPSAESFAVCNDKGRLLTLCRELGVAVPERYEPAEAERRLASGRSETIVVKPCRDVGGGEGVAFVRDGSALREHVERVTASFGEALVTEVVPGPVSSLVALHLLFDRDTRLIASFGLRKQRQWPPVRGVTVAAVSTRETALIAAVRPVFEALRWRGAADVELKVDERDGVAKILEINPRFSGALSFAIDCGVNQPERYARAALGERLPEDPGDAHAEGAVYVDASRWAAAVWSSRAEAGNWRRASDEWRRRLRPDRPLDATGRAAKWLAVMPGLGRRHA